MSKAKDKQPRNACAIKTSIGGQALMEGIMMRGPKMTAMAVRNPQGEIIVEKQPTVTKERAKITKLPIIRGVFNFAESMIVGYKALMRSAEISGLEEAEAEIQRDKQKKKLKKENEKRAKEGLPPLETIEELEEAKAQVKDENTDAQPASDNVTKAEKEKTGELSPLVTVVTIVSVVLAVVLALGLFKFLPTLIYAGTIGRLFTAKFEVDNPVLNSLIKSVFEGILKIALLVGYMALISLMKDIRRVFQYHGAEHKTIFCYEAGLELTVDNVRLQRRFHPRCGTSFIILMLLVNMFISFFIDPVFILITGASAVIWARVIVSILLLPLVMGIGYELIKLAGRHDNIVTKIISAPGMWLQHLTVFEPDDSMIECAIKAVNEVIPDDGSDRI